MCDNINSHAGTRGEKGAKGDDGGCGRHREEGQGGRQHSQRLFRQGVQQVQNKLSLVADGGKSPKLIVCKSPGSKSGRWFLLHYSPVQFWTVTALSSINVDTL